MPAQSEFEKLRVALPDDSFDLALRLNKRGGSRLHGDVTVDHLYYWQDSRLLPSVVDGKGISWQKIMQDLSPSDRSRTRLHIGTVNRRNLRLSRFDQVDNITKIRESSTPVLQSKELPLKTIAFMKLLFAEGLK